MKNERSPYKSWEGHVAIITWYDQALQQVPFECESTVVTTRHGKTHILAAGPADAPPVLFLHGTGCNALAWQYLWRHLLQEFRLLAIDIIGQPGKSSTFRPRFRSSAYAEWLGDLLDELRIARASLVGHSLGGWLALKAAMSMPKRIRQVCGLGTAGLVAPSLGFWLRMIPLAIPAFLSPSISNAQRISNWLFSPGPPPDHIWVEWQLLLLKHFNSSLSPPPFGRDELRAITASTLILTGSEDAGFNPSRIAPHAKQITGLVGAETIQDSGHTFPINQAELAVERVRHFINNGQ